MRARFAGTGVLVRLALRLDRVRLPLWIFIIVILPSVTAAQYATLYPTTESIEEISGVISNPSVVAMNGPLFHATLGGLTTWKILATEVILAALMNMLTVIRHTRGEEEAGRLELIGASRVGRYAPLTAALATVGLADAAIVTLIALSLIGTGLPAVGSVALGLAIGLGGLVFAAVAAVAAQLTTSSRSANAIAASVLGVAYVLRAMGDTGTSWLNGLSPIGWIIHTRPFAIERWSLLFLVAELSFVVMAVAYALAGRRDLGAGYLPQRPGPATAAPSLRSPLALAWRLHRGTLVGWMVGLAVWGTALGGITEGIDNLVGTNQALEDMLARMGGHAGILNAYLATVFGITGLVVSAFTVQSILRLHGEETSGRVEPLLATQVGRLRLATSHLLFSLLGTAALLAVAGLGCGVSYGVVVGDIGGQVPRMLASALVQVPAAWVLAGLGVALFGFAPRLAALTWAILVACFVLMELGALLKLPQWMIDVSPFAHTPKLPGATVTATPLLWLLGLAAALIAIGLTGFRRRDII